VLVVLPVIKGPQDLRELAPWYWVTQVELLSLTPQCCPPLYRRYRSLPATASDQQRSEALAAARARLDELAAAIGTQHMLARGAMRYFAQANVMAGANKLG
jgi:hypothetical protein